MLQALRFRWMQGVALAVLAMLVTTCAVFAPLYSRALQQSMAHTMITQAPPIGAGLQLTSLTPTGFPTPEPWTGPHMVQMVPAYVRAHLQAPVLSTSVRLINWPDSTPKSPTGSLLWRDGFCAHVTMTSGACPTQRNDIAISTEDAKNFGWEIGQKILVAESVDTTGPDRTPHKTLTVAGIYTMTAGPYWFGSAPVGDSGAMDFESGRRLHDAWLTSEATMAGPVAQATGSPNYDGGDEYSWIGKVNGADLPLDASRTGIDELLAVGPQVAAFVDSPIPPAQRTATALSAVSGIPDLAASARLGQEQAKILTPLFIIQLTLLAALTLWLALGAAIDQRRPDAAIARLRGMNVRETRRMLLADLGSYTFAGAILGTGAAMALAWLAERFVLADGTPFEFGPSVWATIGAVMAALAIMLWFAVRRTAAAPPALLLRRVAPRVGGWGVGFGDLIVIVLCAAGLLALMTGSLTGPAALAAPTFVALGVGLLLSHTLGPLTRVMGRKALRQGRVGPSVALLQIARRPASRRVIATVTVATALLVFAGDALLIGARNREARAQAETGAAAVLDISSANPTDTMAAVRSVDPTGRQATTVASVKPPAAGSMATVAVDPEQFAAIAQRPGFGTDVPWAQLAVPTTALRTFTGTTLTATVSSTALVPRKPPRVYSDGPNIELIQPPTPPPTPLELRLILLGPTNQSQQSVLAALPPTGRASHQVSVPVPCEKGCALIGFSIYVPGTGSPENGTVTVSGIQVDGTSLELGGQGDWRDSTQTPGWTTSEAALEDPDAKPAATPRATPTGLGIAFTTTSTGEVTAHSNAVPAAAPAIVAGNLPPDAKGNNFQAIGLGGVKVPMQRVARAPYVPAMGPTASIVNIHTLQRFGDTPDANLRIQIWLAKDDPPLIATIKDALADKGLTIVSSATTASALSRFNATAATWGLQLGVVVGGAAALIAGLVLIIAVATSWRLRARDYAALRMAGVATRSVVTMSVGEQWPIVLISVLLGVGCGLLGAHYAMPSVPFFTTPPAIPIIDLSPAWTAIGLGGTATLIVLTLISYACGHWVASRAELNRLRETL